MNLKAPNQMEMARKYVRQCPPAISGQGGHTATFRVAVALVRRFGLGEADALAVYGSEHLQLHGRIFQAFAKQLFAWSGQVNQNNLRRAHCRR